MRHSTDRILVSHVGSLIRPAVLREIMQARDNGGAVDNNAFALRLKDAVAAVIRWQTAVGIDIVSDGEFGKVSFLSYMVDRLTGFERRPLPPGPVVRRDWQLFPEFYDKLSPFGPVAHRMVCVGPITYKPEAIRRDIANVKAAVVGVPIEDVFLPVIAPMYGTNEFYRTEEEFLEAQATALNEEYRAVVDAGLILQVDDPALPSGWDLFPVDDIAEYRKVAGRRVEMVNYALRGIPEDRVRYHVCWGSWHGPHATDLPLRHIADIMLTVNAQAYSIEGANPRHEHEYHVWESVRLPKGKLLIPGVIAHSTNHIEHPELVAERIIRYAERVGRENVIAGADCGFAQSAFTERCHPSIVQAKFRALAEGARIATGQLWNSHIPYKQVATSGIDRLK